MIRGSVSKMTAHFRYHHFKWKIKKKKLFKKKKGCTSSKGQCASRDERSGFMACAAMEVKLLARARFNDQLKEIVYTG